MIGLDDWHDDVLGGGTGGILTGFDNGWVPDTDNAASSPDNTSPINHKKKTKESLVGTKKKIF